MAPNLLSLLRQRLTCHGDLATSRLRVLNPPSHFLVGAGHSCCCDVVTGIVLGSSLMLLHDRKGDGEESKRRRIVSVVKGWIDRKHSNNGSKWKEKQDSTHKGEGSNALYSCFRTKRVRMKTKSKDLSFIHGTFEGRLNPKIALRPFSPILFLLVAHDLDKWITNVWARTMLLA